MGLPILWQFLRHPRQIGAIAASSSALSRRVVSDIDLGSASLILEYGPGTGALTKRILERKSPSALFCAIESNERLAERFRRRFPEVTLFRETVENVVGIIDDLPKTKVDCIVSGLPWASFDDDLQDRLLDATHSVLREGGTFVTFAYLTGLMLRSGKQFRRKLHRRFSRVSRSPVVWWNLPPAIVYRCAR
ncbi:MAG TPA: methyltransferase domain-containing protein [Phycisphaerae bacterium]|nr:methyltransferase domain-containing protein [Phycisphaerae bacterium]